jgi:hypothetical protein
MRLLALMVVALLAGCAHTDPLSAGEHRNEANIHASRAARDQVLSTQDPARLHPLDELSRPPGMEPAGVFAYSPVQDRARDADQELREAASHLDAARRIEAFEDAACRDIPKAERAACPLLASSVATVKHTPTGFQLVLKDAVDAAETHRRLSCHLAFAASSGFDRPTCPLFVKGLHLDRVGKETIAFEGDTPLTAAELQTQARRVFVGLADPSALR